MVDYNRDTYIQHLSATIHETYPKYAQQKLLKSLDREEMVRLRKATPTETRKIDLSDVDEEERLTEAIQKLPEASNFLEKAEFIKSYKYATLFTLQNLDEAVFGDLVKEGTVRDFRDQGFSHDVLFDEETYTEIVPTMLELGNVIVMKFSRLLSGFDPRSGVNKKIKYPILAIFFKSWKVFEIRLDQVRSYFQGDDYFYHKQIEFVLEWVKEHVDCEIENINLPPIIELIRNLDQDDVNVHAQAMSLKNGGKAVLETGINENYILPLLGELKELIKANDTLFSKSPEIKTLVEDFILETEASSDLPWISLIWKGEKKSKGTVVKFKHNYMNQDYTLLQYYGLETGMERMNNVTEYIVTNKGLLDKAEASDDQQSRTVPDNS